MSGAEPATNRAACRGSAFGTGRPSLAKPRALELRSRQGGLRQGEAGRKDPALTRIDVPGTPPSLRSRRRSRPYNLHVSRRDWAHAGVEAKRALLRRQPRRDAPPHHRRERRPRLPRPALQQQRRLQRALRGTRDGCRGADPCLRGHLGVECGLRRGLRGDARHAARRSFYRMGHRGGIPAPRLATDGLGAPT